MVPPSEKEINSSKGHGLKKMEWTSTWHDIYSIKDIVMVGLEYQLGDLRSTIFLLKS